MNNLTYYEKYTECTRSDHMAVELETGYLRKLATCLQECQQMVDAKQVDLPWFTRVLQAKDVHETIKQVLDVVNTIGAQFDITIGTSEALEYTRTDSYHGEEQSAVYTTYLSNIEDLCNSFYYVVFLLTQLNEEELKDFKHLAPAGCEQLNEDLA